MADNEAVSSQTFSKFLRRAHLYSALFLTPWVLMYAVSTFVMNHKERPAKPTQWELVSRSTYEGVFREQASHHFIARQILMSLGMDGAHQASLASDGTVTIQRFAAVEPIRLQYRPGTRELTIEKQKFAVTPFLTRMHRRRGYQHPYTFEDTWAVSVDFFIVGILFWSLSGLWLWWELKVTRIPGAVALAAGGALFALFLATL
jgi:hypothetical protein